MFCLWILKIKSIFFYASREWKCWGSLRYIRRLYTYTRAVCNCLACQWGIIYGITMIVQYLSIKYMRLKCWDYCYGRLHIRIKIKSKKKKINLLDFQCARNVYYIHNVIQIWLESVERLIVMFYCNLYFKSTRI